MVAGLRLNVVFLASIQSGLLAMLSRLDASSMGRNADSDRPDRDLRGKVVVALCTNVQTPHVPLKIIRLKIILDRTLPASLELV
jgi:hypothetical protein